MKINAYRFSELELSHMERLFQVFKANEYDLIRWPEIYYCDYKDLYPNNEIDKDDIIYENRIYSGLFRSL